MKVAGLLLAAGGSTRFGQPKQLLNYHGQPLVRRIVAALAGGGCSPVVVVVGRDREAVAAVLQDLPVELLPNELWKSGIGSSIRVGVDALARSEAMVIAACDQPHVDAELIRRLLRAQVETNQPIVASAYSGTLGVPALFTARFRHELLALSAGEGAKTIIMAHPEDVAEVDFPQGAIDIDTPADYQSLQASP